MKVPPEQRGPFQTWGKYLVAYKAALADGSSQGKTVTRAAVEYTYAVGMWHEDFKNGLWLRSSVKGTSEYFAGVGRILRLLVDPTDFIFKSQDKARRVFVQAMTPVLFVFPSDKVIWPMLFDPDGASPLEGPFVEPLYTAPDKKEVTAQVSPLKSTLPVTVQSAQFSLGGPIANPNPPQWSTTGSFNPALPPNRIGLPQFQWRNHIIDRLEAFPRALDMTMTYRGFMDGHSFIVTLPEREIMEYALSYSGGVAIDLILQKAEDMLWSKQQAQSSLPNPKKIA